jgi:hypothetical protein
MYDLYYDEPWEGDEWERWDNTTHWPWMPSDSEWDSE